MELLLEGIARSLVGSSNGRTTPFGGVCRGSNPLPTARNTMDDVEKFINDVKRFTRGTN